MDTNTKPAYPFLPGTLYEEIGYCWLTGGDFCTFLHLTPCAAFICNTMDINGWELYVQPREYNANFYNPGKTSYIATYVKRNRTNDPTPSPPELPN